MTEHEHSYEMLMPFVVCKSEGGPYEDAPFVAGWSLGYLEARLELAALNFGLDPRPIYLPPEVQPQVDLLAMQSGFTVKTTPHSDDWMLYEFERGGTSDD